MEQYSEEQFWHSFDGQKTKIKDLEDTHLSNIINHMKKMSKNYSPCFITFMEDVAERRGLSKAFLERSEIPHKDKNGNWVLWNYEVNYPMKVG